MTCFNDFFQSRGLLDSALNFMLQLRNTFFWVRFFRNTVHNIYIYMWDFFQEVVFILMSLTWTLFEGGLKYGNPVRIQLPL